MHEILSPLLIIENYFEYVVKVLMYVAVVSLEHNAYCTFFSIFNVAKTIQRNNGMMTKIIDSMSELGSFLNTKTIFDMFY